MSSLSTSRRSPDGADHSLSASLRPRVQPKRSWCPSRPSSIQDRPRPTSRSTGRPALSNRSGTSNPSNFFGGEPSIKTRLSQLLLFQYVVFLIVLYKIALVIPSRLREFSIAKNEEATRWSKPLVTDCRYGTPEDEFLESTNTTACAKCLPVTAFIRSRHVKHTVNDGDFVTIRSSRNVRTSLLFWMYIARKRLVPRRITRDED